MILKTGSAEASAAASLAAGVIKDSTGAQLISKTLDNLNTAMTASGPKVDSGYQFRKDVLGAMGLGNKLNSVV